MADAISINLLEYSLVEIGVVTDFYWRKGMRGGKQLAGLNSVE
jgi:hypothetical protein